MLFLCRLFGHRWRPWGNDLDTPDGGTVVFRGVACQRCGCNRMTMTAAGCSDDEYLRLLRWSEHFEAKAVADGATFKVRVKRENVDGE